MGYTLVAAVLCLAILRLSEGVAPVISEGSTPTKEFAEITAAAGTAFTLTSDTPALYTLGGTDGTSSFDVTPTTSGTAGVTATVTIKSAPVFATKPSYSLTVTATNPSAETTVATVTLNVIKRPAFTATSFTASACTGISTGTVTTTDQLTATVSTGRTPVYAIASGNTGSLLSISTTTGQISVASSKTLIAATYTLVVTAADNTAPVQTGTTTIVITVSAAACSGSAAITGSLAALLCMIFSIIQKLA